MTNKLRQIVTLCANVRIFSVGEVVTKLVWSYSTGSIINLISPIRYRGKMTTNRKYWEDVPIFFLVISLPGNSQVNNSTKVGGKQQE